MPFELTIHERDGPARTQVLSRKIVFFGRREDNDVVFPFTFVSSRHGRLFLRDGAVFVEDMGSTNGTLVNGEPLTPMIARVLQPEDRVQIERIAIQVRWTEEAAGDDADSVTYHEMPRPLALPPTRTPSGADEAEAPPARPSPSPPPEVVSAPIPAPFPPSEPTLPAPLVPSGERPLAHPDTDSPRTDLQKAAHLGPPSFSEALATGRPLPRNGETARDPFLAWEVFFKTVGLIAVLGGLVLLVFVLVA
jgi:predicted component of type VI protein secretion system